MASLIKTALSRYHPLSHPRPGCIQRRVCTGHATPPHIPGGGRRYLYLYVPLESNLGAVCVSVRVFDTMDRANRPNIGRQSLSAPENRKWFKRP